MRLKLGTVSRVGLLITLLASCFTITGCSKSKSTAATGAAPAASPSPAPSPLPSVSPSPIGAPTISVINVNSEEIWLAWESPEGATSFDFRIANSSFSDDTITNATAAIASPTPTPTAAGQFTMTAITGLTTDLAYYLGIRSVGEPGFFSTLSNIANVTTGFGMAGFIGWGKEGWQMGTNHEIFPSVVHVTLSGDILITDHAGNRVVKLNAAGKFVAWTGGGSNGWQTSYAAAKPGTALGYFGGAPAGISSDAAGNIYVIDARNGYRVVKIASDGTFVGWIGNGQNGWQTGTAPSTAGNGDGSFGLNAWFAGLSVGPDGMLYVVDYVNNRIQKWTLEGNFLGWYGHSATPNVWWHAAGSGETGVYGTGDQQFAYPKSIAFDSTGNMYVAEGSRVQKFIKTATDATLGAVYGTYGGWIGKGLSGWQTTGLASASGAGDGYFNTTGGLSIDSAGNIYVTDIANYRIQKWDTDGIFLGWFGRGTSNSGTSGWHGINSGETGLRGSGDEEYMWALATALDSSDNLLIADTFKGVIAKYSALGQYQGASNGVTPSWTSGLTSGSGQAPKQFYYPTNIALDSSNNIYVSEAGGNRINKYQVDGTFVGWLGGGNVGWQTTGNAPAAAATSGSFNTPRGLTVATNGDLYVADSANNQIQIWSSAGVFQNNISVTAPADVKLTVSGQDTFIWVVTAANFIQKLNSNGTVASTLGSSGSGNGQIGSGPRSIDFDQSGNIYVADVGNRRVCKWNSAGIFLGWIGKGNTSSGWHDASVAAQTPAAGIDIGEFTALTEMHLYIDRTHEFLYVSDETGRIQKFGLDGSFMGWHGWSTPGWQTSGTAIPLSYGGLNDGFSSGGMAQDSNGILYLADSFGGRVLKFR